MLDFIQNIDELIKIITLVKDRTQEDIAKDMGYARPYFNTLMKSRPEEVFVKAKDVFKEDILLFVRKYGSLSLLNEKTPSQPTLEQVAISMEVLAQSVRQIANSVPFGSASVPVQNLNKGKKKNFGVPFSGNKEPHSEEVKQGKQKDNSLNSGKENS